MLIAGTIDFPHSEMFEMFKQEQADTLKSPWVSLITGLEYCRLEQWNGKWNGTISVCSYS